MPSLSLIHLLIICLAAYRLSALMAHPDDSGPFHLFEKLREFLRVKQDEQGQYYCNENELGRGWICPRCNSIWIGFVLWWGYGFLPDLTVWLCIPFAISAGALFVWRWLHGES